MDYRYTEPSCSLKYDHDHGEQVARLWVATLYPDGLASRIVVYSFWMALPHEVNRVAEIEFRST